MFNFRFLAFATLALAISIALSACNTATKGKSRVEYASEEWDETTPSATIAKNMLRFDDDRRVSVIPLTRALVQAAAAEAKRNSEVEKDLRDLVERRSCFLTSISGENRESVQIQNWNAKVTDAGGREQGLEQFPVSGFWARKKVMPSSNYYEFAKDYYLCAPKKADLSGKVKVNFDGKFAKNAKPMSYHWEFVR
jgi:hypothetical protein